jgi:hypothetical protein
MCILAAMAEFGGGVSVHRQHPDLIPSRRECVHMTDTVEKVEIWKGPIFLPGGQSSEKPH